MEEAKARIKEPSTWAGLAIVFGAMARVLAHDYSAVPELLGGLVAIFTKEKGSK